MHSDEHMTKDAANRWLTQRGYMQETEQDAKDRYRNDVFRAFYKWSNDLLMTSPNAAGIRAYLAARHIRLPVVPGAPIGFYPTIGEVEVWLSKAQVTDSIAEEFLPSKAMRFAAENSIAFFYRTSYDQFSRIKLRNVINERRDVGKTKLPEDVKKEKSIVTLGNKKGGKMGFFTPSMEGAESDHAIVVEGEFDALALLSMCRDSVPDCVESIFCFGSGSSIEDGMDIIPGLGIDNVYMFPDNDEPGINYAFDVADAHPHAFIIKPEDYKPGEDPADWAVRSTFEALQETFRQRIPAFSWIGTRLAEEASNGSVEAQSHAKEKVLKLARRLSATNRELFLKSYAPITGVSFESLVEETQDTSTQKYRKVYAAEGFGLQMITPSKGEMAWEPIANGFMEIDGDTILDNGQDTIRHMTLRIIMYNKEVTVTISAKDYTSDNALYAELVNRVGSDLWIKPKFIGFFREAASLLPRQTRNKTESVIHTYTGWLDDKFLMPNGYVDAVGWHEFEGERVELPTNPTMFTRYKLNPPPADMSYIRSVIRDEILNVFPHSVTLPMIAHTFLPPLMRYITTEKPYCLWIQGLTGSFKTTYTALLNSFWGDFKSADFETFRSTTNAIERIGYTLKDCPFIVDDYKKSDVADRSIITLIHNYAEKRGRGRLNPDSTVKQTWPIRGLLTGTGEDIPAAGEASVMSRLLLISLKQRGNTTHLTKGQLHAKYLPGVMAKFIQFILNKQLTEDKMFDLMISKKQKFSSNDVHARTSEVISVNSLAWDMFAEFLDCQDLSEEYYANIAKLETEIAAVTKEEEAGSIYLNLVRDLLYSGTHYLEGSQGANDTPHQENAKLIGQVTPTHIFLIKSVTMGEVNGLKLRSTGSRLAYSESAIYSQLLASGALIPTNGGKLDTAYKPTGFPCSRAIKIAKGAILSDETSDFEPKYTPSEVRSGKDSSNAV